MRAVARLLMVAATVLAFGACGGSESAPQAGTPASTAASGAEAEFGVAECDAYMKQYLACIDRMPAEARTQARQTIEQTKATWKQAAATEQGRAGLAMSCKAASDAAAPAMRAYGCSW